MSARSSRNSNTQCVMSEAIGQPARKIAESIWPGVVIVPTMSSGYSDGNYLNPAGVPTYGLSACSKTPKAITFTASTSACACSTGPMPPSNP